MKRILITGMSGTGKSTLIGELRLLGYRGVCMDEAGWSEYTSDGDWVWREDRVRELLAQEGSLFVAGCATNQGKFYPQFDEIVLLSVPASVLVERLATRTTNPYGKTPEELAETLHYLETVEPLLRRSATREIDATASLALVVAAVLRLLEKDVPDPPRD